MDLKLICQSNVTFYVGLYVCDFCAHMVHTTRVPMFPVIFVGKYRKTWLLLFMKIYLADSGFVNCTQWEASG